ncbi:hypothetical protein M8494_15225 [Serratia ureilytica]
MRGALVLYSCLWLVSCWRWMFTFSSCCNLCRRHFPIELQPLRRSRSKDAAGEQAAVAPCRLLLQMR